ncbi:MULTISPECIES: sensor histidine kinase [unclassified Sphingomonas]|uniref:sensor histidine kinase n=1 Tax=unclassified Sphingomonas TaxID=196159 RepID=UPI00030BE808|nr:MULTISPECIES: sensor histidine kinase KdpD [unclassified Sphingomonas]KTF68787.1 histidine kinase [Sphingomonas sp. WG]
MSDRPNPDALLREARREARGRLKIFLGAAPGVGKTFEMLREGAERQRAGVDVAIGVVETHGRADTEALVAPLEILPRKAVEHQSHRLEEMDLDAILARRPALVLVDELAHTNAPGCRHPKRWQDVEELRDAGIHVYTTLNVQHVESLNDVVASVTRVRVRETVPDAIFDDAEIELVDLPPDELIDRLKEGKVYVPAEASRALAHFFSKANLSALREMALRRAALSVDRAMLDHLDALAVPGTFAAGERVLVAVSELPGGDGLVRAGKRLADALKAPWQVVFVETPRVERLRAGERHRVAEALQLASSLGATVARVPAATVIEGLRTQLAGMRATQLVIGRSRRSWWFELRHGSVVESMLRASDGVAVHVLPAAGAAVSERRALPVLGRWHEHAMGALAVALTVLLGRASLPLIGAGGTDLLFLLPVILIAFRFGFGAGVSTAAIAGLAYNFFFLPPLYTFTIGDPQSVLTFFVLTGIALFTANLTGRLRARATLGTRSAQENAAVAAFGQALARASDPETTSRVVCEEIAPLLGVSVVLLVRRDGALERIASAPEDAPPLGAVDLAAAEWAWSSGEAGGVGTGTLISADWQFHPLRTSMGVLAVIGLAAPDGRVPITADRALLLSTLLGQAALAHERLRLEQDVREVSVLRERDRLRAALLSSIGHDLRTPLTSVAAAVDAIAQAHPDEAATGIARAEVARLRRFLDNLIDMVRIDAGAVALSLEAIDLTDAAAAAVHDLRDILGARELVLRVPPDLPLVRADPRLLHHILLNLLSNAAVHGGEGAIEIIGTRRADGIRFAVRDHGPGLRPGEEASIFETFARGTGSDRARGSGLGLAIAKGFADAMQAPIHATNAEGGGAMFAIDLAPLRTG